MHAYPSEEQVVEFAVWMSMRRERACLAQRAEAGARLTGLVKRTVRNKQPRKRARSALAGR